MMDLDYAGINKARMDSISSYYEHTGFSNFGRHRNCCYFMHITLIYSMSPGKVRLLTWMEKNILGEEKNQSWISSFAS